MTAKRRASTASDTSFDIDDVIRDREIRVIVCCGAGGVGKTTVAAATAVRAAESGRAVVVLTIDPALRLAQSLGLTQLDNTPRPVTSIDTSKGGSLDAMMLDMKRTFDEVVEAHSSPERAAEIMANPIYQAVSSSFAGTQEYMAMEKLSQLRTEADRDGRWDLIVLDTPPSRSALDFLDAPHRLSSFLDGRFVRVLMAPAKVGGRTSLKALNFGVDLMRRTMNRVFGGDFLGDIQAFVAALDTMFGGFRERADATYALLGASSTAFVVVSTAERETLREAAYFIERLSDEGMPLAGLIVNRVTTLGASSLSRTRAEEAAEQLEARGAEGTLAHGLLRLHAELSESAAAQADRVELFTSRRPEVPVATIGASARDIHDLAELRAVGAELSS